MENNFNLIFENIRLKAIDKLYQEADSLDEVQRGVALINESLYHVYEILEADGWINHSGGSWLDQIKPKPSPIQSTNTNTAPEPHNLPNQPMTNAINNSIFRKNNIVLGQSKYTHNLPIR